MSTFHFFLSGDIIMTRINVVPVESLHDKNLLGENKEITLVRNTQAKGKNKWNVGIPSQQRINKRLSEMEKK